MAGLEPFSIFLSYLVKNRVNGLGNSRQITQYLEANGFIINRLYFVTWFLLKD